MKYEVNHNSVHTWRNLYIERSIKLLMSHPNIGYKPSKITDEQEQALREKLNDPLNGMVGFIELLDWFNKTFKTELNYKTFYGFVVRKYKANKNNKEKSDKKGCTSGGDFKKNFQQLFQKHCL